jgi:hypothetical protein
MTHPPVMHRILWYEVPFTGANVLSNQTFFAQEKHAGVYFAGGLTVEYCVVSVCNCLFFVFAVIFKGEKQSPRI